MTETNKNSNGQPFDFIPIFLIIFKKKKPLFFNLFAASIIAVIYSFFIVKVEYQSAITFFPPKPSETDISFKVSEITSLTPQSYDIMNEQIFSLFESKALKRKIIEKFNLYEKFQLTNSKNKFFRAEKRLNKDLSLEVSEVGYFSISKMLAFTISAYSTSPDTAQQIAQFTFNCIDSAIQKISTERASRNRLYIEKQLMDNNKRLASLQEKMKDFQEKNKTIDVKDQVMLSIQTYSHIKGLMEKNELLLKNLKTTYSQDVPKIQEIENNIAVYKHKLNEIERDTQPDVFPGFAKFSTIFPEYTNLTRDVEIKQYLISFLIKEAEKAKIQEKKSVSSLIIIDPAMVPEYRDKPQRTFLIMKIMLAYMTVVFISLFIIEIYTVRKKKQA
jgi:capsule polysaccharide export protein KpsE/RkpR